MNRRKEYLREWIFFVSFLLIKVFTAVFIFAFICGIVKLLSLLF